MRYKIFLFAIVLVFALSVVSAVCVNTPGFQCSGLSSQSTCNSVSGCNWNTLCSGTTYCSGVPFDLCQDGVGGCSWFHGRCMPWDRQVSCSVLNGRQSDCNNAGCTWSTLCQGTPSCSGLSESSCNSNSACDWYSDCTPESDSAFCLRVKSCGSVTAADNCGSSRTVNCGGCTSPNTCQNGQCVCISQDPCGTDECGSKTDNCGTVKDCGVCVVSAATCTDDERIMRLYLPQNSHGATYDQASYPIQICSASHVNHACTDSILWLYGSPGSVFNSHVSTTANRGADYNVPICGLESCVVTQESCGGDVILSLYSEYNSHLAEGDFAGYNYKVCCGGAAYWADANGDPTSSADVGDVVKMIVPGAGDGVEFTIEERTGFNEWVFGEDSGVSPIIGGVNANGDAVGVWEITQVDYDRTAGNDRYAFFGAGQESEEMSISGTESDDPIDLEIIAPYCGEVLTQGTLADVTVDVSDVDDIVTGTVQVDGASYDVTNGVSTFEHTFNTAGNIQIVLTGENTRGEIRQVFSNIIVTAIPVVDETYLAACIDKPEDYADIDDSTVLFDARSSKAVRCAAGGTCSEIAGSIFGDWDALRFGWTFSDGRTHPWPQGSDSRASFFVKTFTQAGDNWAELSIELA